MHVLRVHMLSACTAGAHASLLGDGNERPLKALLPSCVLQLLLMFAVSTERLLVSPQQCQSLLSMNFLIETAFLGMTDRGSTWISQTTLSEQREFCTIQAARMSHSTRLRP